MSREQHRVHGDPQRFEVVADFIAARYGNTIHCIADVAGGKGILTRLLTKKKNFEVELIDPRRTVLKGIDHRLISLILTWQIITICWLDSIRMVRCVNWERQPSFDLL